MNRLSVTLILFLVASYVSAQDSYGIKGTVLSEINAPMPGATVFLANTTKGTLTDADGKFELNSLAAGGYNLVFSFIGYQPRTITIHVPENKTFRISLNPGVQQLKEVVITEKRLRKSDWFDNLKTFKENFIGLSEDAGHCFILNERALSFKKKLSIFEAAADSLLLIQNEGLGYSLKFLLEKFRFDLKAKKVVYKGQTVFTPLVPKNQDEKIRWANNRLKAYYGSEMHFIRSLYQKRLVEEGFFYNLFKDYLVGNKRVNKAIADTVLLVRSKLFKRMMRVPTIWGYDKILDALSTDSNQMIAFEGQLEIVYVHERQYSGYIASRGTARIGTTLPQKSRIILLGPRITIEPDGQILNDEELFMTQGYWSWELVSESLPYDYNPADDLSIIQPN
ncbi:MAG: carboxypeptidase-like regulatory domain-containing protein [Chryseolinea sp.]